MKKVVAYVLVMAWLFAGLDFGIVYLTRINFPFLTEWMHNHEVLYRNITVPLELFLSAPSVALKPIFYEAFKRTLMSQETQDWITHAPNISIYGFYHLVERGKSWTFVPWFDWFSYWTPISIAWMELRKKMSK